jgi:hypothetical protein
MLGARQAMSVEELTDRLAISRPQVGARVTGESLGHHEVFGPISDHARRRMQARGEDECRDQGEGQDLRPPAREGHRR